MRALVYSGRYPSRRNNRGKGICRLETGRLEPGMLVGGVVEHQVGDDFRPRW